MSDSLLDLKLQNLARQLRDLEAKADLLRQVEQDCSQGEELLKPLRWSAKQAEQAYVEAEQNPGWFGIFGYSRQEIEDRHAQAVAAREAYDAAKSKLKSLFEERDHLRAATERLPEVRREYEQGLQDRAAKRLPGGAEEFERRHPEWQVESAAVAELQGLVERCQKQLKACMILATRSDRSLLFTMRKELIDLQQVWEQWFAALKALPETCPMESRLEPNQLKDIQLFGTLVPQGDLVSAHQQYRSELEFVRIRLEHAEKRLHQQAALLQAKRTALEQQKLGWLAELPPDAAKPEAQAACPYEATAP